MAKADTKNAHIRKESTRREDTEVVSEEARRILDDPAFQRGFNVVKDGLIKELMEMQHDGSAAMSDYQDEVCRALRTLHSVRRGIGMGIQREKLRLFDFTAKEPEED